MDDISVGHAVAAGLNTGGWFLGRYVEGDRRRRTDAVEVKWGVHPEGSGQAGYMANPASNTLSVLVSGVFRLKFIEAEDEVQEVVLKNPGDYAVWGGGTSHAWDALTDCVVLTVRWPSAEDDQVILGVQEASDGQAEDHQGP